jgi:hypothetical protein
MARTMSAASVAQLQTETRMQRRPRQVVQAKWASPEATMRAVTASVRRS